ncbi:ice-binding family protein [Arthrobacter bambusae]|uniref:ice-binding family protein n=1 Tax=Arthrobacter bambusae TaxID=1338426 RepID=UPI0027835158|nr:hypothetical protein [Arthrobacter bambusae]
MYSVLAATMVTSTGATTLSGDLGVSPGTAVVGFPPGVANGATRTGDQAAQAQTDLLAAYNDAAARTPTAEFGALMESRVGSSVRAAAGSARPQRRVSRRRQAWTMGSPALGRLLFQPPDAGRQSRDEVPLIFANFGPSYGFSSVMKPKLGGRSCSLERNSRASLIQREIPSV